MLNNSLTTLQDLAPHAESLAKLRRQLHSQPELAFSEFTTSAYIADCLREYGYAVETGIAETGLVATLKAGAGKKSVGLRADFDGLPICEQNTFAHISKNIGTMHACGHDGHTAILLGAARHLAKTRNFDGTLHLIFQPAEECGFDSGAKRMIGEGLFTRFPCDAVFAMHNHPGMPTGSLMFRPGEFMAAGDRVFIRIISEGGHAARPHLTRDPIVAASSIVMALQSVVSRNVNPSQAAVVTVGKFSGGSAPNIIPSEVELSLSVRSFSDDVRKLLRERITALVELQAKSYGVIADINYVEGYPVVNNTHAETRFAVEVAKEVVGEKNVVEDLGILMGSEDFAYMLQACPGTYLRIGNGSSENGRTLHSPKYDFNDENLVVGATFWARLVERFLVKHERLQDCEF